jgi:flagellar basal body P-ring formation protein FlgA
MFPVLGLMLWCLISAVAAQPSRSAGPLPSSVDSQIRDFISAHPSLSGREYFLSWGDRTALPSCGVPLEITAPTGRKILWGSFSVSLRCTEPQRAWRRLVPVKVAVMGQYATAARPLASGEQLLPSDISWVEGDLSAAGDRLAESVDQLVNKQVIRPIAQGAPIRLNDVRFFTVIKRGDMVTLTVSGAGFSVATVAYALEDAPDGAAVQVRTKEGKIIRAVVVGKGQVEALAN